VLVGGGRETIGTCKRSAGARNPDVFCKYMYFILFFIARLKRARNTMRRRGVDPSSNRRLHCTLTPSVSVRDAYNTTLTLDMATAVHFGDSFNWDQEEEKSLRGERRRKERKQKRRTMAETKEAQLHLVLLTLLDAEHHDDVLKVFESRDYAAAVFDSMVKKAQINTEDHSTRSKQLEEFRNVWPGLSDDGKAKFDEFFAAVGLLFERKFGLVDSESSEDDEKTLQKAKSKAQFSTRWFSVNETETVLRLESGVGKVVVQSLPGTFTTREPIFKDKADSQEENVKEDEDDKKEATTEKPTKRSRTEE